MQINLTQINDMTGVIASFWTGRPAMLMRPVDPPKSRFTRLCEPVPTPLSDVGKKGFTTLLAGGIVNPFGPTLNVIAADGHFPTAEGRLPVLLLTLNPFSQCCETVGYVEMGDLWSPLEDLEPFLSARPFRSCPTLLIPSAFMTRDVARAFYARFLETFEDGADVLAKVRQFPGDPWSRTEASMEAVLQGKRSAKAQTRRAGLNDTDALELAITQLAPDNIRSELAAFLDAWESSIQLQNGSSSARSAMPIDTFIELFSRLCATCDLPFLR